MKQVVYIFVFLSFHVCAIQKEELFTKLQDNVSNSVNHHQLLCDLIQALAEKSFIQKEGAEGIRETFVILQAAFEKVLFELNHQNLLNQCIAIIHTPAPATPLCTETDVVKSGLLSQEIDWTAEKIATISERAALLQNYLAQGGTLHLAFPFSGLLRRSEEERSVYEKLKLLFPEGLVEHILKIDSLDKEYIGATYLFSDKQNETWAFNILGVQAIDANKQETWAIWLGPLNKQIVSERLEKVLCYLRKQGVTICLP